ncbi:MAG: hypothetical protein AAF415_04270 [Pseudomonadota bacterium]
MTGDSSGADLTLFKLLVDMGNQPGASALLFHPADDQNSDSFWATACVCAPNAKAARSSLEIFVTSNGAILNEIAEIGPIEDAEDLPDDPCMAVALEAAAYRPSRPVFGTRAYYG